MAVIEKTLFKRGADLLKALGGNGELERLRAEMDAAEVALAAQVNDTGMLRGPAYAPWKAAVSAYAAAVSARAGW